MAATRWLFTKSQLLNTPSRKNGIDSDKELSYRQQAANLIQDMGQRLQVTQLCINTAIVYMHRFYMFQSFTRFPRNEMAPASLFLAAKVEEQPRKLEHVIRVAHTCLHRDNTPPPDPKSEAYLDQAQTLVINENILLQTLGFEITVDHPHTQVVKTCQLVKASKDLAQTSYFLATNSLHLTTLCLQYRPTIVACVCIHLACKWSSWEIPRSSEGKEWYYYIDRTVTLELLEDLTKEFLNILEKCPSKLRKKIMGWKAGHREGLTYEGDGSGGTDARRLKQDSGPSHTSASTSKNLPQTQHHKHTNHDRKDGRPDGRPSHTSSSSSHQSVKTETHAKPNAKPDPEARIQPTQSAQSVTVSQPPLPTGNNPDLLSAGSAVPDMKKFKSESSVVNYKAYMQRKEKEKQSHYQQGQMQLGASASSSLNKSLSGHETGERKHKYQKLDTSLPTDVHSNRGSVHGNRTSHPREDIPPIKLSLKQEPGSSSSPQLQFRQESVKSVKSEPVLDQSKLTVPVPTEQMSHSQEKHQHRSSESSGSGNPPIKLHIKQDPGSGGTPKRLHIKDPVKVASSHELHRDSGSPLKLKIKTSHIHKGSEQKHGDRTHRHGDHGGHHSGHERSGKHSHRDKNSKSHKHSHADREHPGQGANGKPNLKLHIKMSDIKGTHSMTNDNRSHRHGSSQERLKHGHNASGTTTVAMANVNSNASGSERSQPWSVTELMTQSTSLDNSPSKKRRRVPTVEQNSDMSDVVKSKAPKTETHHLKRSSSSHSVVSMDMSDNEPCLESNGSGTDSPRIQQHHLQKPNQQSIDSVQYQLQQLIDLQSQQIAQQMQQQQQQAINRQQSLFDLESYYPTDNPPLPPDNPPDRPPPPPENPPPPPPPH